MNGVKVFDKKFDMCQANRFNLPLGTGSMDIPGFDCPVAPSSAFPAKTVTTTFSKSMPHGAIVSTLQAADGDGNKIMCWAIHMKF